MAEFTIELKYVLEIHEDIGLNDYPIFDESYRESLNKKIIDHYWNREIGQESIEMFIFAMRRKMNEIMPLYNALYRQQVQELDPLVNFRTRSVGLNEQSAESRNVDIQTATNSVTEAQSGTTVTDTDNTSRTVSSDFPQQALADNGDYASSAADAVSSGNVTGSNASEGSTTGTTQGNGESTNTAATTANMTQTSEGFTGVSLAAMIAEYRDTFVNTDMAIIDELQTLFMLIWSTGSSFTKSLTGYTGGMY